MFKMKDISLKCHSILIYPFSDEHELCEALATLLMIEKGLHHRFLRNEWVQLQSSRQILFHPVIMCSSNQVSTKILIFSAIILANQFFMSKLKMLLHALYN